MNEEKQTRQSKEWLLMVWNTANEETTSREMDGVSWVQIGTSGALYTCETLGAMKKLLNALHAKTANDYLAGQCFIEIENGHALIINGNRKVIQSKVDIKL